MNELKTQVATLSQVNDDLYKKVALLEYRVGRIESGRAYSSWTVPGDTEAEEIEEFTAIDCE